jgi:hypothetical protein
MSDKKRNTFLFFFVLFRAKNIRFITSAGGGVGALEKNPVKKSFPFFYQTNSYCVFQAGLYQISLL